MVKHVDSGGQVHLVTNIRKPRKWRRYEYLLSSGTLYINTGVGLASDIKIEMNFIVTNTSSIGMLIGAYYDNVSAPKCLAYTQNNKFSIAGFSSNITSGTTCTANQMYNLTLTTSTASMNTDVPLWLFARSNDNNYIIRHPGLKIYSTAIYSNNTLIRDFVPAQYNGQYGMWDLVEDKFYPNKGTGSFTVGPEIKNYDEIYEVRKATSLLPSGVELYDYILSSGTLYIKMGTTFDDTSTFEIKIKRVITSNSASSLIGYRQTNAATGEGNMRFVFIYSTGLIGLRFGANYDNSSSNLDTNPHILTFDGTNLKSDGTIIDSVTGKYSTSNYQESYLFNCNATYTSDIHPFIGILYYCKFYKNGVLVRNFLPCTYLGEPGMWDTVENKFYRNQGTGLFTLGNKITLKEYEYLEANKGPYINTEYYPNGDTTVEMELMPLLANDTNGFFGAYPGSNWAPNSYGFYGSSTIWNGYSNDISLGSWLDILPANIKHKVYKNKNIIYIDGKLRRTDTYSSFNVPSTLLLFAINKTNDMRLAKMRLYYAKVWDDNNLIRNYIPITYNGTPGLWDKVEWKFYANAGSGSFTLGPEKASGIYPVSYLHDRTVYEEPDGSKWLRIVHHNNPSVRRFNLSDSFTTYVHTSEDLWFDASWCNTLTRWELMVKQKPTSSSAEQKYRWVQNVNPMIATFSNTKRANVTYNTSSGYTTPDSNFGGLYRVASDKTYLNGNNNTDGNWWGSIGNCTIFSGGLPGWNTLVITTGYEDLYVRIA